MLSLSLSYTYIYIYSIYIYTYIYTCSVLYVFIYIYVCVYSICMYMYMHVHMHVHVHMHMYIYMYMYMKADFSSSALSAWTNISLRILVAFFLQMSAWGIGKLYKTDKQKGVDHYCGTTKALACTSKSYRMIAILDAIMMVSSTADHALKEIAAAHIHPCKSPLTSRFTIFIPFIPILQNFPVKFNTGPPCGWDPFSWPQKCASPFLPCPQSPLKWLPTARYWWYVRYRWRRAKLCILRQACSGKLGNSTSQCSRMHDDYPRVS